MRSEGMGRIPVADPARRALSRLRTRAAEPASGALLLTYFLGAVLFASGLIRCVLSFAHWRQNDWMMLISGIFGVLAGILILFGFPSISVWALGFLLGVYLISHGLAWLLYALQSVRRTT
jgi:uncharacterized membrane protein HdeD (DUF308 family)